MERQDPQGEENGDPAFAHVPRIPVGPHGQHIPHQPMRGGSGPMGPGINHPPTSTHPLLPGQQQQILQGPGSGNHHPQLSTSSKDSTSSNFPPQKQLSSQVSVISSIPQSSNITGTVGGGLQHGAFKGKDANQLKLQQLQSQQQQLLIAAAAVASSSGTVPHSTSALMAGKLRLMNFVFCGREGTKLTLKID